jgi:transposase
LFAGLVHGTGHLHGLGHEVRLIPPAHAKAYVYRNKTDPADAEAISAGDDARL